MIRVGVVGATGYGARELIRLLAGHPEAWLVAATSESAAGQPLGEALPALRGTTDVALEKFDAVALAEKCDVVFIGVPSTKSMEYGKALRAAGVRTLDLGADFRLKDVETFRRFYKVEHTAAELLGEAVYGLAPLNRERLRSANLVAVPGCYPISIILALYPLLGAPIHDRPIVVDSISGVSGAGRSATEAFHFPEMNENVKAYRVATHQHTPEIEQELGYRVMVQFTPHVGPYTRGILSTITIAVREPFDVGERFACYQDEPFVRVLGAGNLPELKYVRASNFCDIGWVMDERTGNLVVVSVIDNLVGGTSGMGIQCMNIMFGLDERLGLAAGGMAP